MLSERELEILILIGKGMSTREIAEKLCISHKTVSSHQAHILERMNMGSKAEIIKYVVESKLDVS